MNFVLGLGLLLCACLTRADLTAEYDRNTSLTNEATLSWSFDNETKMFSFGLEINTTNVSTTDAVWVGIGIGEQSSGSMLGADIFTAEFDKDVLNNCTTTNRHVPFTAYPIGSGNTTVFPNPDRCQSDRSWKLISCKRDTAAKTLVLEVRRPVEAVTDQDRAIGAGSQPIMYAYGVADTVAYHHTNRATTRVMLVNRDGSYPETAEFVLPDDVVQTFTMQAGNFLLPNERTTYACVSKKLNLSGEKMYMVAAENIIEEHAHHFLVYGCADNEYTRSFSETKDCSADGSGGVNDPRANCTTLLHGWAAGARPNLLPDGVGYAIDASTSMIMLEIHYDNPKLSATARDDSGVKLHLSKNRSMEAGTIWLNDPAVSRGGQIVKNDFNYTATCPSSCTSMWQDEKINVFAGLSHMHTTGKYMWTNRYNSDGVFQNAVTSVAFWSNDHQAGTFYSPPLEIRRGDILSTTCNFDTSKLPNTKFGPETQDEMCIDFLSYYPVQRRNPTDGASFMCGMIDGTRFPRLPNTTGTVCGNVFDPQNHDYNATNPSFDDTVGFRDSFGNEPATCSVALAGNAPQSNNGSMCFPAGARVSTKQRGVVTMAELRIGDQVEVGAGEYSAVYMFTHREESKMHEFVELETERGARLRLTAGHFVYADGALKRADEVRVGEHVADRNSNPSRVVSIGMVVDKGLYNPQTLHGDIVVEGVVASTYTRTFDKPVAHAMLAPMRAVHQWLGITCGALEKDDYLVMRVFQFLRRWATGDVWFSLRSLQ